MKVKVYEYSKCSTCRNALKFLDKRGVEYEKKDITTEPPSKSEIEKMIKLYGGEFKKLFNTSGLVYKEMNLSEKVKKMTTQEAIQLLSKNGRLIKRPFLLFQEKGLVGFREEEWKEIFK